MAESLFDQPRFQNPDAAREHLESVRWPSGPVCPHCGAVDRITTLKGKSHRLGLYECGHCRDQFTVTVGTVFERSKVPPHKWLMAATLFASSKKGMSAHQLHRMLGVTYKTAWFMAHRLREAMKDDAGGLLGGGGKPVEVDETYWGNKKPKGSFGKRGAGGHHQMKIVSLVERGGRARSFQFHTISGGTVREVLRKNIEGSATVHTDESSIYKPLHRIFATHETVNHRRGEYSRGNVTTNTVEGIFLDPQARTCRHVSPRWRAASSSLRKRVRFPLFHALGAWHRGCRTHRPVAQGHQREAPHLSADSRASVRHLSLG